MSNFTQTVRETRIAAVFLTPLGLLIALLFLITAITGLIKNEREALAYAKTLAECNRYVISVGIDQVDPINDGNLIHLSGSVTIDETLIDEEFKVEAYNVIELRRTVEMYQWQRIVSKNESGEIEYSYEKEWLEHFIDSTKPNWPQKYYNQDMLLKKLKSKVFKAKPVNLGGFLLPSNLVKNMTNFQELPMTELDFWKAEDNLQDLLQEKQSYFDDGNYYVGQNPAVPQMGDLRIKFEVIQPGTISVIAKQNGSGLIPYRAKTGTRIDPMLEDGTVSAEKMFWNQRKSFFSSKLKYRFFNFFLMFVGIYIIFNVLWIAKTSIIFFGNPANAVGWLLSLIIATVLTFLIIGYLWKDFNPIAGGILLVIALVPLFFLKFVSRPQQYQLIPEKFIPQKIMVNGEL